jgi:hypothetical protein
MDSFGFRMEIVELIDSIKAEMDSEIDRLREEVKNLRERVNWKSSEEEKPPKDGTKFLAYVNICVEENRGKIPGVFKTDYKICWREGDFWKTDDPKKGFQILKWMEIVKPKEEKIPEWKRLELCCENLYKSTQDPFPQENPSILMFSPNEFFVMHIEDRINFCPWCGMKFNNE